VTTTPAPTRPATTREKFLAGLGLIVLMGVFVLVSATGDDDTRYGLKVVAAFLAVAGTLIQMFLASHWASKQHDGETAERYADRLVRRDRWEASGWAALCLSVIVIAATQIWD
jgi:Na+/melibiose symporter-like transporter